MRIMMAKVTPAALVAVAALLGSAGVVPTVRAQNADLEGCTDATLTGGYGLKFSGFFTRGTTPAAIGNFTPVAGGGLMTFDGRGGLTDFGTVSIGGQIVQLNVSGTYTVNPDCTGTLTTPAAHLSFVIVRNGREIMAVNTDPGNVVMDNLVKL